jgi:hypothetical protein
MQEQKMKTTTKRTRPRTGQSPPLSADFASPALARGTELDQLKERLLEQLLPETSHRPDLSSAYERAASDAVSLAWVTPFPLLVLPVLFEEKAAEARRQAERQRTMLVESGKWKAVA